MGRAVESSRREKDRLFYDPLAMSLLPPTYQAIVRVLGTPILGPALLAARERQMPGIMGNLLCRTRFIDDTLQDALARGFEQVVILGAGLDSRAYRISGMHEVRIFELDHPATQAWKRARIEEVHGVATAHVTFVPIDFESQTIKEVMAATDFRAADRTLLIWEGVTQYIGAEAVDATFRYIAEAIVPGGEIVFTYVDRGLLDGPARTKRVDRLLSQLERQGEPWSFGILPVELPEYLTSRGLSLIEDVGALDYRSRYLEPLNRELDVFEGERVARAEPTSGGEML